MIRCALVALVTLPLWPVSAHAETIAGRASIIDADTLEIHGERIRILDIDAPESRQTCTAPDGTEWRCGQAAANSLSDWIGARPVTCETTKRDKYGRRLARCSVGAADLATWLADTGLGVPCRDCKCEVVRNASARAKVARRGIWSGTFMMPWDWRAQQAKQSDQPAAQTVIQRMQSQDSGACLIKGNINSRGDHIYHVPSGKWYEKTKIDTSKGERWFCTEAEAQAAGWRPAMQ